MSKFTYIEKRQIQNNLTSIKLEVDKIKLHQLEVYRLVEEINNILNEQDD
jgi:hypothetical protein